MKNRMITALVMGAIASMAAPAIAGGEGWTQDYDAAIEQARAEGKDLLIDFTGSDWCVWCQRLDEEVFATDTFKESAPGDFVLVMLDFPRDESLVTDEVRARNDELQTLYGVQGFPTIFLTDADGVPYAQTGYQKGGPDPYLEHLAELKGQKAERDSKLSAAEALSGTERAQALDEFLADYEDGVVFGFFGDRVAEICSLDADDTAGLKSKWEKKRIMGTIEKTVQTRAMAEDWQGLVDDMDALVAQFPEDGEIKQQAFYFKALGQVRQEMMADAIATLRAAEEVDGDPRLGQQISMTIQALEEQVSDSSDADEDGAEHGDHGHDHDGAGH